MDRLEQRKSVRILFDEYHSESWTISEERAREINPEEFPNSSYQKAANALASRDFTLIRNTDQLLTEVLQGADVLVLTHLCSPVWEKTTSNNSPNLSPEEIQSITDFVKRGGGLIVISEYEHFKYSNNVNELLAEFGLEFENTTVSERTSKAGKETWVFFSQSESRTEPNLLHNVSEACFYRAASIKASGQAQIVVRASASSRPKRAGLIATSRYGDGRVVVVSDSDLFGDEFVEQFDHLQLWLNINYWAAAPAFRQAQVATTVSSPLQSEGWATLKTTVNALRKLQNGSDGSLLAGTQAEASTQVSTILDSITQLSELFPHQSEYLKQAQLDLQSWADKGFNEPDFSASLACFNPQQERRDNIEHLIFFPVYTPNASEEKRFEALIVRIPWPDWLASIESETYSNPSFVPAHLVDFTDGYDSECAVFFPEMVVLPKGKETSNFGIIFCDREAKRFQRYVTKACEILRLNLPPQLEGFLTSLPLIQDTFALWDLIHDQSHSRGALPFALFVERKKLPFWMYALEELRVDLRSFAEVIGFAERGFPFAMYVTYAVLFDRIFRFAISGKREKNYDALAGQLLASFLHKNKVTSWEDSQLSIDWKELNSSVLNLRDRLIALYTDGVDLPRLDYWLEAHDVISEYVKPNLASIWKKEGRQVKTEDPKMWLDAILIDEFPLSQFHSSLRTRMNKALGLPADK